LVKATKLSLWQGQFLAPGQAALKDKTGQPDPCEKLISRLKKKVGELTMENEL